ncbi:SixA phosphatase family protein [Hephaestia sp. GCM10023244]|uniref:SixA phosphatase family protein n=1 Tax=unclassified Hephaestia TaxID=2631281 RepID=UPI0020772951|nr:histidine phosphatase family protein [Hephaestia sp. MAHUQ-44]MCM8731290.1 histidine phosphatase family protein [Hephaestia sp. MAHUQ-44]
MKTLTLLRHAKSGWDDPVERDFDRPLNAKGERAAQLIGRHLRSLGLEFDHIIASPAARVGDTIDQLGAGYGRAFVPEWDRRLYLASPVTLLDVIHGLPAEAERVLLIGHNPGLEELVLLLVPDDASDVLRQEAAAKYPTATVAEIRFADDWPSVGAATGTLTRFIRPRDLDPALGPDQA